MIAPSIVDLFAGPGGWDLGAQLAGLGDPVGIEWDDAACETRRRRRLPTIQADVAELDPRTVVDRQFGPHALHGLIASPPCQAFSAAGKGQGRRDIEAIHAVVDDLAAGRDTRRERGDALGQAPEGQLFGFTIGDPRSLLVVEPLRWALALMPRWIAFEQVPPVLPLWEQMAGHLAAEGYSVATGIVTAEQYGVPQTRRRALLVARLDDGEARLPPVTHTAYRKGAPRQADGLLPWVSMADALGWSTDERVGFPRLNDRIDDDAPKVADPDGKYRARDLRSGDEPSFVVTEKARSWARFHANHRRSNAAVRDLDEPAPTITGGHDSGDRLWIVDTGNTRGGTRPEGRTREGDEPAPTITSRADQLEGRAYERRQSGKAGPDGVRVPNRPVPVGEPAPTITGESRNDSWVFESPATTVAGDSRIQPPGHKLNADDVAAGREYDGRAGVNAIRVEPHEAAALQTFPVDYPWAGVRSKVFEQIGNAVPPVLAAAVLAEVTRPRA